jgi:hypothetical protein
MSPELKQKLEAWLTSADPVERRHAAARLGLIKAESPKIEAEVLGSEALRAYLTEHPCGGC